MKLRNLLLTLALGACALNASASSDPAMDRYIDDLMSKMTLREKLGQLNLPVTGDIITGTAMSSDIAGKIKAGEVGGLFNLKGVEKIREVQRIAVEQSRLGIPLIFGMDVIHGYETVFPIPFAMSMSWDMEAIRNSARIAAVESTADGICWTFSPMVDVCREPRWGRMSEGSGEDPYLGSEICRAMVEGYQGADLASPTTMMSCIKHFALYGAPEGGRDYNTVDMSHVRMFNEYFPPYKAGADAGAGSFMTSFNTVDYIPATGNRWLMTDVLRGMWGFDGFVVTDYTAISEMINHGMGDLQQVSALALNAGTDMDMVADGFLGTLEQSLNEGKVTMQAIDQACRRILEAKYKLGLFSDPYRYLDVNRAKRDLFTAEHRAEARRVATETFVLLENRDNVLPLTKQGTIALVGPLANTRANMPGTWSVAATSERYSTLLEAMQRATEGKANVLYAKGCNVCYDAELEKNSTMFGREMRDERDPQVMRDEAVAIARQADVIVAAMGEPSEMSGECSSRSQLTILDAQKDLLEALIATGKPIVLLNFSGRTTVMNWEKENIPTILNVWFGGSEAADAICDVIFGDVTPSGHLSASMPRNEGQIPVYYNHLNTGRPLQGKTFQKFQSNYLDVPNDPLYPFGYGLSYTTFDYGQLALSSPILSRNGSITATITVTNTGNCDGAEVVQLYVRDMVGSIARPVSELKDFKRIFLKAGETQTVTFTITADKLKFYDNDLRYDCEPGDFQLMVGRNSADVQTLPFTLTN
ncbi:MAG: beta-glucosidase BglX [Muribaculaceae bacterium]|nr:beta-glucosidase BglX [Muribaculaceae bacterium]